MSARHLLLFRRPALTFDFTGLELPAGATLARASTGWYFDSAGVLQSAANDVARFNYNPSTFALEGLLAEPARTNVIRNSTAGGAVAGSPGTLPTNWAAVGTTGSTRNLAIATEDGIEALHVAFSGTAGSASSAIHFDSNTAFAASVGQTWTGSVFLKLLSGSFANIGTAAIYIEELASGGAAIATMLSAISIKNMTTAALRTQRFQLTRSHTHKRFPNFGESDSRF